MENLTRTPVTIAGRAMVRIDCGEDYTLHRIGSDNYTTIRHTTVPADMADTYEALPLPEAEARKAAAMREADYKAELVAAIRRRYDADDELAILRQRDTKPDEFAAYNAYAEACKTEVRAAIAAREAEAAQQEPADAFEPEPAPETESTDTKPI